MVRTKKGFTLVELMVVIVIIGILAALAIPKFTEASVKAKVAEAPTVLSTFDNAVLAYLAETSDLPSAMSDLVIDNPATENFSNWFNYTSNAAAGITSATLTATPQKKMGLATTSDNVVTTISDAAVVAHTNTDGFDRYLPNWEPEAGE